MGKKEKEKTLCNWKLPFLNFFCFCFLLFASFVFGNATLLSDVIISPCCLPFSCYWMNEGGGGKKEEEEEN